MKNKYIQLLFDTGVFVIGNFLVKLIQYFLLPLYTSAMTTQAYGTAELLNNFSEMLFPIVTMAIYEAVFRFSVDHDQDKDSILYESLRLLIKTFMVVIILASFVQFFANYRYTYYLLFVLFTYSVRMLFANFARGSGYVKCFSLSGVVNGLSLALLSWLLLVKNELGVSGYLLAIGCSHTVSAFVLFFGADIDKRLKKRKKDKQLLIIMLKYSTPLILNNIAWWFTSMSSRYIVLFVFGAGTAGLYTAANKLPAVISVVSQVFQQAWQLNSSREYKNEGYEIFFDNILKIYSSAIFIFGSSVICATPLLAKITLKNEFYNARQYIPPMMLAVIISCLSAYFGSLLIAFKKTRDAMNGMVFGAVVNILFSFILIKPLGIWGCLLASNLCYLAILVHRMLAVKRLMFIHYNFRTNITLFTILCIQTILMCFTYQVFNIISILLLILMICICFFSYYRQVLSVIKFGISFLKR